MLSDILAHIAAHKAAFVGAVGFTALLIVGTILLGSMCYEDEEEEDDDYDY